jgi:sulfide:quinone oxidoreductase
MPMNVLIVGAGPAALEAALVLRRTAGDRVATTVLAPEDAFAYRPLSVLSPFAAGGATSYPLARIAADAGFAHVRGRLARVDVAGHAVETEDGDRLGYDVLLVATGAKPVPPFPRAVTFTGGEGDAELVHGLVQDVEEGYSHRIAFVVPAGNTWPLPLYELALMLAERAYEMQATVELHLVTPEAAPLGLFGPDASRELAALMDTAGIAVHAGAHAQMREDGRLALIPGGETLAVERVVTVPVLEGPAIDGLPADASGFLVTDPHGRVLGIPNVYAAGDGTAFPVKQGGLACQQADAAAEHIASSAGAAIQPQAFHPVLRGMLLTERWARFLRRDLDGTVGDDSRATGRALWWPPTKIAGRELAGYLEGLDDEAGRDGGLPVLVEVSGGDARQVEVLGLLGAR